MKWQHCESKPCSFGFAVELGFGGCTMSLLSAKEGQNVNEANSESCEVFHEDLVDPRVQVELERLNTATDLINKLEIELDEARSNFRLLLSESSIRVNQLAKKLGSCVEKARPYYEARMHAKQLQTHTQKAALRYERASSAHCAAKEMVYLAEEGLQKEGRCFDPAWQEMLNHATLRVNEAESERVLSQYEHQKQSMAYNEAEKIVQHLQQELKKSIVKSSLSTRRSLLQLNNLANQHQLQLLPYFEMKAQFNQLLEEQRKKVHHFEENILKAKVGYADALHNLEEISDEIHRKRESQEDGSQDEKNSEIMGAESLHSSYDSIVMSFPKYKSKSMSIENIENLNSDDLYMSLPSKFSLRSDIIAVTCKGNHSEELVHSQLSGTEMVHSHSQPKKEALVLNAVSQSSTDLPCKQTETNISSHLSKTNNQCEEKQYEASNISSETEATVDSRFLVPDFNLLRIQREEMSDNDSLASNDTTDTLDDNQIDCLLLGKVLTLDVKDTDSLETLQ